MQTVRPILTGFNSQPPEGGWLGFLLQFFDVHSFNSQPPEGGWVSASVLTV